jgi:hypothetical protein
MRLPPSPSYTFPDLFPTLVTQLLFPYLHILEKHTVVLTGRRLGKPQYFKLIL